MSRFERARANPHFEKWISGLGGFLGVLGVLWLSSQFISTPSWPLVIASVGASAVLVFAVPHGPLSQPWPLVGSHLISGLIGVTCARFIPSNLLAGSLAVGLSILAMYYLHCIHPPGGATALTAVMGGEAVRELGYAYLIAPVLLNTIFLLCLAIALNWSFEWRRYPAHWNFKAPAEPTSSVVSHDHLAFALEKMGSFIDVSETDLREIYHLAQQHAQGSHLQPEAIQIGRFYSHDSLEAVREVLGQENDGETLVYREFGSDEGVSCTRGAFALWAQHEVRLVGDQWVSIEETASLT